MRYFTRELWLAAQKAETQDQCFKEMKLATEQYVTQLTQLQSRLNPEAYKFFAEADVHDGELLDLAIEDGSRPGPLSQPPRPWKRTRKHPVAVRLSVLDGWGRLVWTSAIKMCAGF